MNTATTMHVISEPIGFISSRFELPAGTPVQTSAAPEEPAQLVLRPAYAAGLRDIEGFDHLILITHLHRCANESLEVMPFLDTASHGVFATRAPARPNRLGLSIVRLLRVDGCTLHIAGNDMVDGTPVLDIKPHVPVFDNREGRIGWFEGRLGELSRQRADDRHALAPKA